MRRDSAKKTPPSTNYKVRDKMGIYDNSVSWNANRTVHTPAKIGFFLLLARILYSHLDHSRHF